MSGDARRICSCCVMDTTDPLIDFDENGVCGHCRRYKKYLAQIQSNIQNSDNYFEQLKKQMSKEKKGEYDCIIGVSGGVDSSYTCLMAKRLNINALLIHFDNGWDSELAVSNIKKIVDKTGFDFNTYVINWPEFRDLQRSFFKASVVDIEMLTDHAIMASLYKLSSTAKTKNVFSGNNLQTEYGMPSSWIWNKRDWKNIKSIHKLFGEKKLKTFPVLGSWRWLLIQRLGLGMNHIEPLHYINYKKKDAIKELEDEYGWTELGGKHYESIFTKFYQAHILPVKFKIDKRKAHFSSLIRNGELTRDEALAGLEKSLYDDHELEQDTEYVIKKLGFSRIEFEEYLGAPPKKHSDYPSDQPLFDFIRKIRKSLLRRGGNDND